MKSYCYIIYNKLGLLLVKVFCVLFDLERIFFNIEKWDIDYLLNNLDIIFLLKSWLKI